MDKELKIVLIHPPKPKTVKKGERSQWVRPLGLHYLTAVLKKNGFKITILDFEKDVMTRTQRLDALRQNQADLYGITSVTYTRFEAIDIAQDIKKLFPHSVIVVGGPHFMFTVEDTLSNVKEIDIVCTVQDGEYVMLNIARAIVSGKRIESMDDIPGIAFRKNGLIIKTLPPSSIRNLDEIPLYRDYEWEDYPEYVISGKEKLRATTIMTSRGCPYQCAFCSQARSVYRERSAENVCDEIEYFKERFGIRAVHFFDSTFAANPKHCEAIAKEIIDRKLNIKWSCGLRANTPLDLLPLMKEAGLVSFTLGIESGSPKILKVISKNISLDQAYTLIKKANQLGIGVVPFFMISFPDETLEDALETLKVKNRVREYDNVLSTSFNVTMIFPGTQIERIAKERNILPKDFSWSKPYKSRTSEMLAMFETVPIYLEKLTVNQIKEILEMDKFDHWEKRKSFPTLIKKGLKDIFLKRKFSFALNYMVLTIRYLKYKFTKNKFYNLKK